jgi:hypothetical protein
MDIAICHNFLRFDPLCQQKKMKFFKCVKKRVWGPYTAKKRGVYGEKEPKE